MQANNPTNIDTLSDKLNPIVVRELRQMVRSKLVLGALMLLLLILVVSTLFYVLTTSMNAPYSHNSLFGGKNLFNWFNGFLTFCGMFFVPLYVGTRLAKERASGNDLLYITTLSPHKIIAGKVLAGVMITVLLFSICLPFLAFSYLLRGIDLPTIFSCLILSFIQIVCLIYLAVVAALFPVSHVLRILGTLGLVFNMFYMVGLSVAGAFGLQEMGIGGKFADPDFWLGVGYASVCLVQGLMLCHFAAVAWLSPESANRMHPIRLLLLFSWVFHMIAAVIATNIHSKNEFLDIWLVLSVVAISGIWLIAISEREEPGHIIARSIPRNPLLRFRSWLTFSGSGGGLIFGLLLFGLTMGIYYAYDQVIFISASPYIMLRMGSVGLYSLGFCLLALALRRSLLKKRLPAHGTWALAIILLGITPLFHLIFMLFIGEGMDNYSDFFQPGNVFNLIENHLLEDHLTAALIFTVLMLSINGRWLINQWKTFQALEVEVEKNDA